MDEVSGQGRLNERAGLSDLTVRVMVELPEAEVDADVDAACDESVSGGFTTGICGMGWTWSERGQNQGDETASSIARVVMSG